MAASGPSFEIEMTSAARREREVLQPNKLSHSARIILLIIVVIIVVIMYRQEIKLAGSMRDVLTREKSSINSSQSVANVSIQTLICPMDNNSTVVLAFGDSLTSGFPVNHPYAKRLSSLLPHVKIVVSGVVGEMTGEMMSRFQHEIEKSHPTVVVILGGTNDIMRHIPPNETVSNIISLHEYAKKWSRQNNNAMSHTIAMTAPDIYGGKFDELRLVVNRGIRAYAQESRSFVELVDLESVFNQSMDKNSIYWYEDGLHFSDMGYDAVGSLLYNSLCSFNLFSAGV